MIHVFINNIASLMATLPSFESALLVVRDGLGLKPRPDLKKSRFRNLEMNLQNHTQLAGELLDDIFEALEMDEQARRDAMGNIMEWAGFNKALELNTWTGNASEKQVLWHMLAYSYVPGMARRLAFWSLAGVHGQRPIDAGMPGGEFWFLPNWDDKKHTLTLPVPQVIDWLLDLLDAPSFKESRGGLGRKHLREDRGDDSVVPTLRGWHKGTTPQSAEQIQQIFGDDAVLNFAGTFPFDKSLSDEDQFEAALAFTLRKELNATTLHDQIPMTVARLTAVLNRTAPDEEKQEFVRQIALRYAKPSMATIRQRLRVARMTQEGYKSLLKALCGDEVEPTCTDPAKNKLLQLLALFHNVYNLTIAAYKNADTDEAQDGWFESRLAPWDKADLLLSIVPSQRETAYLDLGKRLTRKFMTLKPDSPLEDLVPLGDGNAKEVIQRRLLGLKQEYEEDIRLMSLVEKVRQSSPGRALEAESSYWVVSQFAQKENLSPNARALAIKRLNDLAATPGQTVGAIVLELGFLLNGEPKQRPKDIQQRVQYLVDKAEINPQGYGEWKAPLLRLRAKHWLMQNEFEKACKDFKDALKACSERGFGGVRGEIARDGLATDIAVNGFIPQNQEVYYRDMLHYGMFPDGMVSIEDTAVWCDGFFWNDLYHPYPGMERKERLAKKDFEAVILETFGLIEKADWDGLGLWMKKYAKPLRKPFKDPRCDSVLTLWLKMLHTFESKLPALKAMLPHDLADEFEKVEKHLRNRRHAIGLLLEAWPEQAKIADFKGQTPLMLVTDNGDAELTRLLVNLSDVGAQDYLGRTALHSAVSGRSPECVAIVIDHYFKYDKTGFDKATGDEGNTALHTAVRFGQPKCVKLILDAYPELAAQTNVEKQTPLDMARDLLEHLVDWQAYMHKANRSTGSREDFEMIIAELAPESV